MGAPLPRRIGAIDVPQDAISRAAWGWAARALPGYLFRHSVRSYAWGAALAGHDGLAFEPRILWLAALAHDVGLTRIARSSRCLRLCGRCGACASWGTVTSRV